MLVGGGILIGVGVSWAEATRQAEIRANERIEDEITSYHRVAKMVRSEAPVEDEETLNGVDFDGDTELKIEEPEVVSVRETPLSEVTPGVEYLQAVQEYWTPPNSAIEVRIEYIDEDTFAEEDGRSKEQILIHMGADAEPLFVNEGVMVVDWQEIIPPTILADMYTRCGPEMDNKVLYVRNHANDTDYEVIQEIP